MKKITLLITLLLFFKVHAQFFEDEFGPLPEILTIDEWSGTDWNQVASQEATFNVDCLVQTITTLISGIDVSRSIYSYNTENQVTEIIIQTNIAGTWFNSSRTQNTYSGDNLTEEIESNWNGSSWVNSFRIQSTFAGNNLTEEIESNWDGTNWENSLRRQNTYIGNNLTEEIESNWDGANWGLFSRTLYNYNGSNQLIDDLFQLRNAEDTTWENANRSIYTYNATDLLEQESYQEWNTVNAMWVNSEQRTYSYTGSNISEIISSFWDGFEYLPEDRSLLTYNADGLIAQLIFQDYFGGDWENTSRIKFIYPACQSLSTKEFMTFDFSFSPNPSSNYLKILNLPQGHTVLNYMVYDMSGRLVQKGKLNSDLTITTQFMTDGLYVLKLSDGSYSQSKQFVVNH